MCVFSKLLLCTCKLVLVVLEAVYVCVFEASVDLKMVCVYSKLLCACKLVLCMLEAVYVCVFDASVDLKMVGMCV